MTASESSSTASTLPDPDSGGRRRPIGPSAPVRATVEAQAFEPSSAVSLRKNRAPAPSRTGRAGPSQP
jgi:hypothetical protein